MIFFKTQGRLGNQLFQVVFLALMKKEFDECSILIFKDQNNYHLDLFEIDFQKELNPYNIISTFLLKAHNRLVPRLIFNRESCLYEFIPSNEYKNTNLSGYFQNGNYYLKHKDFIFSMLNIRKKYKVHFDEKYKTVFKNNKVITIHVRRGDYNSTVFPEINSSGLLPLSWYETVFNSIPSNSYDKIFIISDCINELVNDPFFSSIGASFENNSAEVDFQLIMNSDCAIISNSSFAWWAAFLNSKQHKKIYAPNNWVGYNVGMEYPKGIMIDDFIWVK